MKSPAAAENHSTIAIIGAGFAGMAMAIRLLQSGRRDFVLFDKEDDVGGTWKVNTYPGCACDVPSHLYSLSAAPHAGWSRAYSAQPEIWAYQRAVAERFDLYRYFQPSTHIVQARFDEARGVWRLQAEDGRVFTAQIVIAGMGGLSVPSIPKLPGQDRFQGKSFHSQQWDHDFDLTDQRIAVIGTGASAIQFVPQIAKPARQLHLYQRTAPWILSKEDHAIPREHQTWFEESPWLLRLKRWALYWGLEWRVSALVFAPALMKAVTKKADQHLRQSISDPALIEALTPNYLPGCKRVLLSDDYYPALARPDVELVTAGIREIREHSIISEDGSERAVDAIIYGTGFKATDPVPPGVVFGRSGRDLTEAWVDGPEAYRGTTVSGFPNLFFVLGPNTGLGHTSVLVMMEAQVHYIMGALQALQTRGEQWCDVRSDAQERYNQWLQARMKRTVWSIGGCDSWYKDKDGKNVTLWPGSTFGFRRMMRHFDEDSYVWGSATG